MKLKLRIGRQRAQTIGTDEARSGSVIADRARGAAPVVPAAAPALALVPAPAAAAPARVPVPLPRATDRRVVRVGTFCPASDIGQAAVTEAQRAVVAIRAGRCGRWVYA